MCHAAVVKELHLGRIKFPFSFLTCSAEARLIEVIVTRLSGGCVVDLINDYVTSLGANIDLIRKRLFFSLVTAHATWPLRRYLNWARLIKECLWVWLLFSCRVDGSLWSAITDDSFWRTTVLNTWNLWVRIDFFSNHPSFFAHSELVQELIGALTRMWWSLNCLRWLATLNLNIRSPGENIFSFTRSVSLGGNLQD